MTLLTPEELEMLRTALSLLQAEYEELVYAGVPLKQPEADLLVIEELAKKLLG